MTQQSDYIVYVDESGDHGLSSMDPNYPMFVLAFCVFEKSEYARHVTPSLQEFKFRHFGHDMVVLHEHEIRKASGPFNILLNPKRREPFMQDLNNIVSAAPFTLFAAAIHKDQFQARHGNEGHNLYHVAVTSCLEALHKFLPAAADEAVTHVVFEARGKREDNELELEFRRVCDGANSSGERFPFQIVFASKQSNSCGLQLADLVARPVGRKLLKSTRTTGHGTFSSRNSTHRKTARSRGMGFLSSPEKQKTPEFSGVYCRPGIPSPVVRMIGWNRH